MAGMLVGIESAPYQDNTTTTRNYLWLLLGKIGKSRGFRVKRWDGFHKPRDSQRIAHATRPADKPQRPAFARQFDRNPHQRRYTRTVNLRHAIEVDNHF